MLGMFFDVFLIISMPISRLQFPEVVQKQTLGEVGAWTIVWWPVVSGIFVPTILEIL